MNELQPKTKQVERADIKPSEYVTVTNMGHILEVQHMAKRNRTNHIQKIDSERYVFLETGEIREFERSENRSDSENSLRQTFKRIRYLINNNFTGADNELFLTMTYAENMQDTTRLYEDLKKFMMRLRYKFKGKSTIDYLNVVEPQARGAWHSHILLRFNDLESIYLPNNEVADLWGHGFTVTKSLKGVDNIGAYLSAYLIDLEIPEGYEVNNKEKVVVKRVDGQDKRFLKGGRLWMYPPGMNLYRSSRGIKMPERVEMAYKDVKKIVGSATPHYSRKYSIDIDDFKNTISYEQYNLKR